MINKTTNQRIREALARHPGYSAAVIAARVGCKPARVHTVIYNEKKKAAKAVQTETGTQDEIESGSAPSVQPSFVNHMLTMNAVAMQVADNLGAFTPWKSYSLVLTREEFVGYLRGTIMDALNRNDIVDAKVRMDKLASLQTEE